MRLSKTTNHAIRVLIECAGSEDELIKVAEISHRLGITQQNTFKIVHLLSRAGFIEAVRGRNGGVKLAEASGNIQMGQVVRAMEESIATAAPTAKENGKHLGQIVDDALDAFTSVLDGYSIADMAAQSVRTKSVKGSPKVKKKAKKVKTLAKKVAPQNKSKKSNVRGRSASA